jgi:hypothetical protein
MIWSIQSVQWEEPSWWVLHAIWKMRSFFCCDVFTSSCRALTNLMGFFFLLGCAPNAGDVDSYTQETCHKCLAMLTATKKNCEAFLCFHWRIILSLAVKKWINIFNSYSVNLRVLNLPGLGANWPIGVIFHPSVSLEMFYDHSCAYKWVQQAWEEVRQNVFVFLRTSIGDYTHWHATYTHILQGVSKIQVGTDNLET